MKLPNFNKLNINSRTVFKEPKIFFILFFLLQFCLFVRPYDNEKLLGPLS